MRLSRYSWLVPLAFLGCSDLDREDRLEDLRILAVRTEPAEILFHPFHALVAPEQRPPFLTLPSYDVDVEVFAYDPRGGEVETMTQLCPEEQGVCIGFDPDAALAAAPESLREELRAVYEPRAAALPIASLDDSGDPAGRISLRQSYRFTPAVIDSFIPKTESGAPIPSFFPELPRVVIDVQNPGAADVTRETGYKRIPVGFDVAHPDLPDGFLDTFGQALGIRFCDAVIPDELFSEGPTDCVEPRGPNQNPTLVGFDLDRDDELPLIDNEGVRFADVSDLGPRSLLRVPRGGEVHLTPVFAVGDREHYQVLKFGVETQELFLENRWEDYVVSWYSTRGDVSRDVSDVQFFGRLGLTWQLPFDGVLPGERDTLVAIARDQRGGTAVGHIVVEYR
ncbi:MAG: hypothetical protein ACO3JL_10165 [Myxococcota bacterium]